MGGRAVIEIDGFQGAGRFTCSTVLEAKDLICVHLCDLWAFRAGGGLRSLIWDRARVVDRGLSRLKMQAGRLRYKAAQGS